MLKAVKFTDLIDPSLRSKVQWNGRPGLSEIPVFGKDTPRLVAAHKTHLHRLFAAEGFDYSKVSDDVTNHWILLQANYAAIAASCGSSRLIDAGCGPGLASIAFSRLTKREAIAVDVSERDFVARTDRNVRFMKANFLNIVGSLALGSSDVLLLANPELVIYEAWRSMVQTNPGTTLMSFSSTWINLSDRLFAPIRECLELGDLLTRVRPQIGSFARAFDRFDVSLTELAPPHLVYVVKK